MNLRRIFQIIVMCLIIFTVSCNTTMQNQNSENEDVNIDSKMIVDSSDNQNNESQETLAEDIFLEEKENIFEPNDSLSAHATKDNVEDIEPCWVTKNPNLCLPGSETETWYYVTASISNKNLDENQSSSMLQSLLVKALIEELSSTIFSKFVQIEQCNQNRECETKLKNELKIVSENNMIPSQIYLKKTYPKIQKEDETIFGLGQIRKQIYQNKLKAIKDNFLPKKIVTDYQKNTTSFEKIPDFKFLPEDQDSCEQVHLNMTSIKGRSIHDVITMIQNDFSSKYEPEPDGVYANEDVLETDSEMTKHERRNEIIEFDEVEARIEKKFNNNMKCWQSESREVEFNYLEDVRQSLAAINDKANLINTINNHLNTWESAVKRIRALEQQHDTYNTYYNKKLAILSYYHLTFTVSMSNRRKKNVLFMRTLENKHAKKKLIENGIIKNIKSEYHEIDDKYYNSTLQTSYSVRITPEYFVALSFHYGKYRGRLRKFKIDFVDTKDEKDSISVPIQDDDENVKSFVILSNDELEVDCDICDEELNKNQNLQKKCSCNNKIDILNQSFNNWTKQLEPYHKLRLEGSVKDKALSLISEVVRDNCRSLIEKQVIQLQKTHKLNHIKAQINEEYRKIEKTNKHLKENFRITNPLPTKLKEKEKFQDRINDFYQNYVKPYKQNKEDSIKAYQELTHKQPIIANFLIEGSYDIENVDKFIKENIESKVKDKVPTFCPDVNWGQKLIHNQSLVKDEHMSVSNIPELVEYSIPQIKLLPRKESVEFTVPIFFKINCTTQSHMFKYHPKQKEIEDLNSGYMWKTDSGTHLQILKRRKKDEKTHTLPSISDEKAFNQYFKEYQNFCKAYSSYRNSMFQTFDLKYPEIKCLNRYEKMNDHNFRDYVRLEHWQMKRSASYFDLVAATKKTNWMMNTMESLENLFYDLKESIQNGDIDESIIQMFSGKVFWTNTRIDRNSKSVAIFDFTKDYLKEESRNTNEKCFGLVTRKLNVDNY